MYNKNKKIEWDQRRFLPIAIWIETPNTVKMSILPQIFLDFCETDKRILKYICKGKRSRIAETILKKNEVRGLILLNSRYIKQW